jgi:hypothetical protein
VSVERLEEPHSHSANLTTIGAGPAARQRNESDNHEHQVTGLHQRNLSLAPDTRLAYPF